MNKDSVTVPTLPSWEDLRAMKEMYERLSYWEHLSVGAPKVGDVLVIPKIENLR